MAEANRIPFETDRSSLAILGALIALGLIAGGWLLGREIKATRLSDRYVEVKGLAERTVTADLAIWPLSYKEAGDDLGAVYAKTETDKQTVLAFLKEQGIQEAEFELGVIRVVDTQANEYGGVRAPHRYVVEQQIIVRTSRVASVTAAAQKTMQLLQKGIVLGGNAGGVTYKFTGLNSIKPDMITEATRNARTAAARFASDSGSTVGAIRRAHQGVFSIVAADQSSAESPGYYASGEGSVRKAVRVVTSVQYFLEH